MSLKEILEKILAEDTTWAKSATRYLYKTQPALWQQVLDATDFLPNSAYPKQRVWHIVNDTYSVPRCPVTGQELAWKEKEYKKYSTIKAGRSDVGNKIRKFLEVNGHWRQDKEKSDIVKAKVAQAIADGKITAYKDRVMDRSNAAERTKRTCLEKYGVENPSQTKEVREKIYLANLKRGATPRHLRSQRRLYYDAVWRFTEQSWKKHFDDINPRRLNRSDNALDHIYSIQQGFRESIPPYIIGHWTNLRVISLVENSIKGMRCDKSRDHLFGDFFSQTSP